MHLQVHEAAQEPIILEKELVDRRGNSFFVRAVIYPTRNQNSINADPSVSIHRASISEVLRISFRDNSLRGSKTSNRLRLIENNNIIELIFRKNEGEQEFLIGFQSYIYDNLGDNFGFKFLYNHYSGIKPDQQNSGLRRIASAVILEYLKPDVIAGSTHSISYFTSFHNAASDLGYKSYPRPGEVVPNQVFLLGQNVLKVALGDEAVQALDSRLVKTDSTPYIADKSGREFLFFEKELALRPEQAALAIAIRPDFARQIGIII